jgi:hypothetical protein
LGLSLRLLWSLGGLVLATTFAVGATMLVRKLSRGWEAGLVSFQRRGDRHTITFLQQTDPWPYAIHLAQMGLVALWLASLCALLCLLIGGLWLRRPGTQAQGPSAPGLVSRLLGWAAWWMGGVTLLLLLVGTVDLAITLAW